LRFARKNIFLREQNIFSSTKKKKVFENIFFIFFFLQNLFLKIFLENFFQILKFLFFAVLVFFRAEMELFRLFSAISKLFVGVL
jgi:hypothetical protein